VREGVFDSRRKHSIQEQTDINIDRKKKEKDERRKRKTIRAR
jgi:hypothetical protein